MISEIFPAKQTTVLNKCMPHVSLIFKISNLSIFINVMPDFVIAFVQIYHLKDIVLFIQEKMEYSI